MGVINNPKKAAYNAVYNRTTIGVFAIIGGVAAFAIGRKYKKAVIEHAENKNDIEEV